jgi:hypothetical protein
VVSNPTSVVSRQPFYPQLHRRGNDCCTAVQQSFKFSGQLADQHRTVLIIDFVFNIFQCYSLTYTRKDYETSCREATLLLDDTACMTAPRQLPPTLPCRHACMLPCSQTSVHKTQASDHRHRLVKDFGAQKHKQLSTGTSFMPLRHFSNAVRASLTVHLQPCLF